MQFFAYLLFQILKKGYLQILKNLVQFFCLSPFLKIKKLYLQILKNLAQFFCLSPFSNIKKSMLTNLKKTGTIFCLSPFSNIKKVYFQILKKLAQFFASRFLNITNLKNTSFYTSIDLHKNHYANNSYKNLIQINKHKAKYITNACIPIIIIISKISLPHNNKKKFFLLNIRVVNQGLNL